MAADASEFVVRPIGRASTPYETPADAPHQGFAAEAESTIEVFPTAAEALAGLDDVLRVTVVYWAHLADRSQLQGADGVGAFARRSPNRPNPLSLCTCTLVAVDVDEGTLTVTGLDAVDGSPVLDIKPAVQAER